MLCGHANGVIDAAKSVVDRRTAHGAFWGVHFLWLLLWWAAGGPAATIDPMASPSKWSAPMSARYGSGRYEGSIFKCCA